MTQNQTGENRNKTARIWIISLIAVAGMLLADQWTKHLAIPSLKGTACGAADRRCVPAELY